jgi:putative ABC transport system permease protein
MNLASIAWKSIRQRWLSSTLTSFSVALGVALMITVLVINGVVTRMFSQSATGFHLILGAKGSPMQLVLNTLYFMDRPIENLPYKYYLEVKGKSWAGHAIPFALGDTTSDGRYRIVGTIPEYFEVEYVRSKIRSMPSSGRASPAPTAGRSVRNSRSPTAAISTTSTTKSSPSQASSNRPARR